MLGSLDSSIESKIRTFQRNEITEYEVYKKLANIDRKNRKLLEKIANEELGHYRFWRKYTGEDIEPDHWKIKKYIFLSRIFGVTFAIKMMETGEEEAQEAYSSLKGIIDGIDEIIDDEVEHERALISMIKEEKIDYVGSMVLGLNDALVELTGALAGLTFALQNTKLTGVVGLITGLAAAMSMASSEYLSRKSEKFEKPGKAATYTGVAYFLTVVILILPYFLLENYYYALFGTLLAGVFAISLFTFFVSVVKELSFKRLFMEMVAISFGIAAVSFLIGVVIRAVFGVDV